MENLKKFDKFVNESYMDFKKEAVEKVYEEYIKIYNEIKNKYPEWGIDEPHDLAKYNDGEIDVFIGRLQEMEDEYKYIHLTIGIPIKKEKEFISIVPYFDLDDWKIRYVYTATSYRFFALLKNSKFPFQSSSMGGMQTDYDGVFEELDKVKEWFDSKKK